MLEISRIQIEGGFLNGFDLELSPGLNVIIGARGTGKTSVIELVRYALGAKSHTVDTMSRSVDHARAVLEDGEISVTLSDFLDNEVTVTRSATDDGPRTASEYIAPIVLSQTEIENIGLSPSARLSLIDGFIANRKDASAQKAQVVNSILSLYREINAIEQETREYYSQEENLKLIEAEVSKITKEQETQQLANKELAPKHDDLKVLGKKLSLVVAQEEMVLRFLRGSESWAEKLGHNFVSDWGLQSWDEGEETDPLKELRSEYNQYVEDIQSIKKKFDLLSSKAEKKLNSIKYEKEKVEVSSRQIRGEIEASLEGAGKLSRRLAQLNSDRQRLISEKKIFLERAEKLKSLREKRNELFSEFTRIVAERSAHRVEVAKKLNESLLPNIRIDVDRAVNYEDYIKAISNALRGSGLKYNDLSLTLAERVSPRELMECVDSNDFEGLSEISGIPKERSLKLISHLKEGGIADVVTSEIGDNVKLNLLDGLDFKDSSELSAGQRCTVVLSIVLQHKERTLIIDQPEDHLDNAFIASTVIHALEERGNAGQVIVSTHNANIPVLGSASLVVELTSDGRNGFIETAKPLDHKDSVRAITDVMEGGAKAFEKRSKFYSSNGS